MQADRSKIEVELLQSRQNPKPSRDREFSRDEPLADLGQAIGIVSSGSLSDSSSQSICPILGNFIGSVSGALGERERDALWPLTTPLAVSRAAPEIESARIQQLADWLISPMLTNAIRRLAGSTGAANLLDSSLQLAQLLPISNFDSGDHQRMCEFAKTHISLGNAKAKVGMAGAGPVYLAAQSAEHIVCSLEKYLSETSHGRWDRYSQSMAGSSLALFSGKCMNSIVEAAGAVSTDLKAEVVVEAVQFVDRLFVLEKSQFDKLPEKVAKPGRDR